MQIWQTIKAAWVIFRAMNQFRKDLDAGGVSRLSRGRAKQLRRKMQIVAMDIIDGNDSGWRKWLRTDDAIGPFLAQFLDSELLEAYISGGTLIRQQARAKIIEEANGIAQTHGNHP